MENIYNYEIICGMDSFFCETDGRHQQENYSLAMELVAHSPSSKGSFVVEYLSQQ
jgi:hypothetical protein